MMMLALLAAAASAQPAPNGAGGVVVQASATVRIVAGARVTLGSPSAGAAFRMTQVRDREGLVRPAQLIEFQ